VVRKIRVVHGCSCWGDGEVRRGRTIMSISVAVRVMVGVGRSVPVGSDVVCGRGGGAAKGSG
jgi:hypothetical protein